MRPLGAHGSRLRSTGRARGWTLVEVVAVLVLLGVLAVLTLPIWQSPERAVLGGDLRQAQTALLYDLRSAQEQALARDELVSVVLDDGTWRLGDDGAGAFADGARERAPGGVNRVGLADEGAAELIFAPDGSLGGVSGAQEIVIEGEGEPVQICIYHGSGYMARGECS